MTRPAGLFNHQELLRRAITEAAFVLALLLLAERRRCHKANQFETMTEQRFFSFCWNVGNKSAPPGGSCGIWLSSIKVQPVDLGAEILIRGERFSSAEQQTLLQWLNKQTDLLLLCLYLPPF